MVTAQAVLLDTDVFSALYVTPPGAVAKQGHPVGAWTAALTGLRPLISFQTRAEVLSGAYLARWGEKRIEGVLAKLDSTPTVDEDREVVEAYARPLADAQKAAHTFQADFATVVLSVNPEDVHRARRAERSWFGRIIQWTTRSAPNKRTSVGGTVQESFHGFPTGAQ